MRVGEKGQVTIPIAFRDALGLLPGSTVEFERRGSELIIHKVSSNVRGEGLVDRLRGRSTSAMTTEELMALTRG
jgi:AbrB family looped-hinge helix DNA binding protein